MKFNGRKYAGQAGTFLRGSAKFENLKTIGFWLIVFVVARWAWRLSKIGQGLGSDIFSGFASPGEAALADAKMTAQELNLYNQIKSLSVSQTNLSPAGLEGLYQNIMNEFHSSWYDPDKVEKLLDSTSLMDRRWLVRRFGLKMWTKFPASLIWLDLRGYASARLTSSDYARFVKFFNSYVY